MSVGGRRLLLAIVASSAGGRWEISTSIREVCNLQGASDGLPQKVDLASDDLFRVVS